MATRSRTDLAVQEIHELHTFFEAWFCGRLPVSEFTRLERALAAEFIMISPNGSRTPRDPLLAALREAHARHAAGGFRIEVRHPEVRAIDEHHLLGTYEEWQEREGIWSGRVSTVLFETDPAGSLRWLHVHETALP